MLRNEAAWLRSALAELPTATLSPLLSIGSGTIETRDGRQPWIANDLFAPLAARGVEVIHHEFEAGNGVNLVGDLTDPVFLANLQTTGARSVLCCNVFEHVPNRKELADALAATVAPGGFAIISVPRAYPYHPDPMDSMYRPTPTELAALFPDLNVRASGDVDCGTLIAYALAVGGKPTMVRNGARAVIRQVASRARSRRDARPGASPPAAVTRPEARAAYYLRRPTRASCVVLERVT